MEKNENETNKTRSVALRLETLGISYDKLLKEYNQMQADYIDYLNQQDEKSDENNKKQFLTIKGQAFWGKDQAADEVMTNNVEECQALCAENQKCTGATFDSGETTCYLRSGMGSTVPAANDYYAIISKKLFFLSRMRFMNSKLEQINKEILDLVTNEASPIYEKDMAERQENQEILQSNYDKLKELQDETERELAEQKYLQADTDSGSIMATSNYTMFMIVFIIAIVALILLVKFSMPSTSSQMVQMGGSLKEKTYYLILVMFLFSFIIYFLYKYR